MWQGIVRRCTNRTALPSMESCASSWLGTSLSQLAHYLFGTEGLDWSGRVIILFFIAFRLMTLFPLLLSQSSPLFFSFALSILQSFSDPWHTHLV